MPIARSSLAELFDVFAPVNPGHRYASVLFALGLAERLETMASAKNDAVGLQLEEERLPKRIRQPRQRVLSSRTPRSSL